jgi:hypothetical protein
MLPISQEWIVILYKLLNNLYSNGAQLYQKIVATDTTTTLQDN